MGWGGVRRESLDLQLFFLGGWSSPMHPMTPFLIWFLPRGLIRSSPRGMGLPAPLGSLFYSPTTLNSSSAHLTLTSPAASAYSLVPDYAFSLFLSGFPW